MTPRYIIGCDPGQSVDPTAIAIVSVSYEDHKQVFRVGHLERLPLGTTYPAIAIHTRQLSDRLGGATVVLDETGVGRAVRDIFRDYELWPICVTITAGTEETSTDSAHFHVPKLQLVSRVQALLHTGQLLIQKELPETPALVAELQDFRATVTDSGRWTFGARAGAHDDLVLALALAVWRGYAKKVTPISDAALARAANPNAPPPPTATEPIDPAEWARLSPFEKMQRDWTAERVFGTGRLPAGATRAQQMQKLIDTLTNAGAIDRWRRGY